MIQPLGAKKQSTVFSPIDTISPTLAPLAPVADNLIKGSRTFLSVVQQAVGATSKEPLFVRTRREAEMAEKEYQMAVRKLDRQRLGLEERIEDTLKLLQKWEAERLRAVKTGTYPKRYSTEHALTGDNLVLLQYQGTLGTLSTRYQASTEKSSTLLSTYQPDQDLMLLMERYRTGPFKPSPQVFESVDHERDVAFGIDLRQWAGEGGWNAIRSGEKEKPLVPAVLASLLEALKEAYLKMPNDIGETQSIKRY